LRGQGIDAGFSGGELPFGIGEEGRTKTSASGHSSPASSVRSAAASMPAGQDECRRSGSDWFAVATQPPRCRSSWTTGHDQNQAGQRGCHALASRGSRWDKLPCTASTGCRTIGDDHGQTGKRGRLAFAFRGSRWDKLPARRSRAGSSCLPCPNVLYLMAHPVGLLRGDGPQRL
jgi:hypothetical protein